MIDSSILTISYDWPINIIFTFKNFDMTPNVLGHFRPQLFTYSVWNWRQIGNMIHTWKILHGHDDVKEDTWFTRINRFSTVNTKLNSSPYNSVLKRANNDIRANSFTIRVVTSWNTLQDLVKGFATLKTATTDIFQAWNHRDRFIDQIRHFNPAWCAEIN